GEGGGLGAGASQRRRDRSHRRGRGPMAERAPLPDAGVPDRRPLPTTLAHRTGANDAEPAELFPPAGQDPVGGLEVRVQRYVAALPEGDRQEGGSGGARAGPVPHHGQDEQGDRRGAEGRDETLEGRRL